VSDGLLSAAIGSAHWWPTDSADLWKALEFPDSGAGVVS
jgi:hypothetical protein